jgi:hypothetical protein
VLLSPVLPLPVELVAGGEGNPDGLEGGEDGDPPGLGGSGRSGRLEGGVIPMWGDAAARPRKIADKGRSLKVVADKEGREREVIGGI